MEGRAASRLRINVFRHALELELDTQYPVAADHACLLQCFPRSKVIEAAASLRDESLLTAVLTQAPDDLGAHLPPAELFIDTHANVHIGGLEIPRVDYAGSQ